MSTRIINTVPVSVIVINIQNLLSRTSPMRPGQIRQILRQDILTVSSVLWIRLTGPVYRSLGMQDNGGLSIFRMLGYLG